MGEETEVATTHLHHVFDYTDVDRAFWQEHLEGWLPRRILDAHAHICDPALRLDEPTEEMRRSYWVCEVSEPQSAESLARCYETVFPGRETSLLCFGHPELSYDMERSNAYVSRQCVARGWHGLAVCRPQWTAKEAERVLDMPGIIGFKPYYAMIGKSEATRDGFIESSIFDFLPRHQLEVLNARGAWVTLHVPRADRLGHPENIREIKEIRRRYPDIVLAIAHLGRSYTEPHAREAIPQLTEDKGLYWDNCAVLNPAVHRIAFETIGPDNILYGTDNPVFYMRGRRQWRDRTYINRTSYPFHFNKEREAPEIEAKYTLYMYEALKAIKDVSAELGLSRKQIEGIFHNNAQGLIERVSGRKVKEGPYAAERAPGD
jgi:hypothetical protein